MALLSDVDWTIIAVVAVFLLFGRDNTAAVRTLGRWYARAGRLKQELLSELSRAADLPVPAGGTPLSIRGALLGIGGSTAGDGPATPLAVPVALRPAFATTLHPSTPAPWTGGVPVPSWSMTGGPDPIEGGWSR
jgi:hypothetical protein